MFSNYEKQLWQAIGESINSIKNERKTFTNMSLRLYNVSTTIPQYVSGHWTWHNRTECIRFQQTTIDKLPDCALPAPRLKFGIQFKDYMDEVEEDLFLEQFARPDYSKDSDVITIQDIKDVALFTAPRNSFSRNFIKFIHLPTVDEFFNDLIIYFEHFLKLVEFLIIRRDEVETKILDMRSVRLERMLAEYLVQHRLILAREYAKIVLGFKDTAKFHHLANKSKQSKTEKDSAFYETFLCFCTRIVWIAMHRKSYSVIDCEINRLLRSDHFNVAEKQLADCPKYTLREQQVLFGPNNSRCNYRNQRSPLIMDLLNLKPRDTDVLWTNEHKYRGTDPRMFRLEMEYVTPEAQLNLFDCHHGILGNPKYLYNTMLALDWHAVRKERYSATYDPYRLFRRPVLEIPNWEEFNKIHDKNEPYFRVISKKWEPDVVERQLGKWCQRDRIKDHTGVRCMRDIFRKCRDEIKAMEQPVEINREEIIAKFLRDKERKLKKKLSTTK